MAGIFLTDRSTVCAMTCIVSSIYPIISMDPGLQAGRPGQNSETDVRSRTYWMGEPGMPVTPLVHVVDDDEAVRDSLTLLLESAGFGVRSYASATALLATPPKPESTVPSAAGGSISARNARPASES